MRDRAFAMKPLRLLVGELKPRMMATRTKKAISGSKKATKGIVEQHLGRPGEEHKGGVNYPICLIITLLHTRLDGSFVEKSASFVPAPPGMIIPQDDIIRWIYYHVVIMIIKFVRGNL